MRRNYSATEFDPFHGWMQEYQATAALALGTLLRCRPRKSSRDSRCGCQISETNYFKLRLRVCIMCNSPPLLRPFFSPIKLQPRSVFMLKSEGRRL